MASYSLPQLLQDVARRRAGGRCLGGDCGGGGADAQGKLAEVWAALDRYICASLEQKKGVVVPNFCRVGWQATRLRGVTTLRPYFQLLESFCHSYGASNVKRTVLVLESDLSPMEEFNFSKAAIRFSSALTKDDVSSGLRALVLQIGEAVRSGRSLNLEFSFGKLLSRERAIGTEFAPAFLAAAGVQGAEDHRQADGARRVPALPLSARTRPLVAGCAAACTERGASEPFPDCLQGLSVTAHPASSSRGPRPYARKGAGGHKKLEPEDCLLDLPPERPVPAASTSGTEEASWTTSGALGPLSARSAVQKQVLDEALHRQITMLETRASEAWRDRASLDGQLQRELREDEQAVANRQSQKRMYGAFLQRQIQAKENRKQAELAETFSDLQAEASPRLQLSVVDMSKMHKRDMLTSQVKEACAEQLAAARALVTATRATSASSSVRTPNQFRETLDKQVQEKRDRREAVKRFERHLEACMLAAETHEIAAQREMEQAHRTQEREVLFQAWREESKIRSIREAIEAVEHGKRMPRSKGPGSVSSRFGGLGSGPESGPAPAAPGAPCSACGTTPAGGAAATITLEMI